MDKQDGASFDQRLSHATLVELDGQLNEYLTQLANRHEPAKRELERYQAALQEVSRICDSKIRKQRFAELAAWREDAEEELDEAERCGQQVESEVARLSEEHRQVQVGIAELERKLTDYESLADSSLNEAWALGESKLQRLVELLNLQDVRQKEELEEVERDLASLREEKEKFDEMASERLAEKHARIRNLKLALEDDCQCISRIEKEVEDALETLKGKNDGLGSLRERRERLEHEIAAREANVATLKRERQVSEAKCTRAMVECAKSMVQHSKLQFENESLRESIKAIEEEKRARSKQFLDEYRELEEEERKAMDDIRDAEERLAEAKAQFEELRLSGLRELEDIQELANEKLSELRTMAQWKTAEEYRKRLQDIEDNKIRLTRDVEELERQKETTDAEIGKVSEELETLRRENRTLEDACRETRIRGEELARKVEAASAENARLETSIEEAGRTVDNSRASERALTREKAEIDDECDELQGIVESLEKRNDELVRQLDTFSPEESENLERLLTLKMSLESELRGYDEQLEAKRSVVRDCEQQLERIRNLTENDSKYDEEIGELEAELEKEKESHREIRQQIQGREQQQLELAREAKSLEEELVALTYERDKLEAERSSAVDAERAENGAQQERNRKLETAIGDVKKNFEETFASNAAKLNSMRAELQALKDAKAAGREANGSQVSMHRKCVSSGPKTRRPRAGTNADTPKRKSKRANTRGHYSAPAKTRKRLAKPTKFLSDSDGQDCDLFA